MASPGRKGLIFFVTLNFLDTEHTTPTIPSIVVLLLVTCRDIVDYSDVDMVGALDFF